MPSEASASNPQQGKRTGMRVKAWNLLLLLPLLMLITPWFNFEKPRLFGLPFFYWYQLAFVLLGVACVWIVYAMTRDKPGEPPPVIFQPEDHDELDDGTNQ